MEKKSYRIDINLSKTNMYIYKDGSSMTKEEMMNMEDSGLPIPVIKVLGMKNTFQLGKSNYESDPDYFPDVKKVEKDPLRVEKTISAYLKGKPLKAVVIGTIKTPSYRVKEFELTEVVQNII